MRTVTMFEIFVNPFNGWLNRRSISCDMLFRLKYIWKVYMAEVHMEKKNPQNCPQIDI